MFRGKQVVKEGKPYVELTFSVHEEDGGYVARCVELGTTSQGNTTDEAFENLHDAVLLHIETLTELGGRSRCFKERGIRVRTYRKPKTSPRPRDIPVRPSEYCSRELVPLAS